MEQIIIEVGDVFMYSQFGLRWEVESIKNGYISLRAITFKLDENGQIPKDTIRVLKNNLVKENESLDSKK